MSIDSLSENILVMVRIRPLCIAKNSNRCVSCTQNTITIGLKNEVKQFGFDYVASELESQEAIFNIAGKPLTDACIEGYNTTIFAYGQTGSGKTYTIQGPSQIQTIDETENPGIMPRIFKYLFDRINYLKENNETEYIVKASYFEIYKEQIIDLLYMQTENLKIREDTKQGVYVEGLSEEIVDSAPILNEIVMKGISSRHIGSTSMNKESSRSHSILTLIIESKCSKEGMINIKTSKFHIIDLAGSERQKNTDATGERLKESGNINKSLSVLGNVINALVETSQGKIGRAHV